MQESQIAWTLSNQAKSTIQCLHYRYSGITQEGARSVSDELARQCTLDELYTTLNIIAAACNTKESTKSEPTIEEKYNELIYHVANKYPNESRHETALRYIKEHEIVSSQASQVKELKNTDE